VRQTHPTPRGREETGAHVELPRVIDRVVAGGVHQVPRLRRQRHKLAVLGHVRARAERLVPGAAQGRPQPRACRPAVGRRVHVRERRRRRLPPEGSGRSCSERGGGRRTAGACAASSAAATTAAGNSGARPLPASTATARGRARVPAATACARSCAAAAAVSGAAVCAASACGESGGGGTRHAPRRRVGWRPRPRERPQTTRPRAARRQRPRSRPAPARRQCPRRPHSTGGRTASPAASTAPCSSYPRADRRSPAAAHSLPACRRVRARGGGDGTTGRRTRMSAVWATTLPARMMLAPCRHRRQHTLRHNTHAQHCAHLPTA
jgi:hypothetical protein